MRNKIEKILRDFRDNQTEWGETVDLLVLCGVINWVAYDWNKPSTHPPKAGRYLIYRSKCDKIHFEQWNGSGWSSSNNDCTHYTLIKPPCL